MSSDKDVSQEWSKVKPAQSPAPPPPPSDSTYQPSTAPSTLIPPSTVSSTTSSEHAVRAIREGLGWLPGEKLNQMDTSKLKRLVMKAIGEDSDDAETVRPTSSTVIDNSAWFVKHSGPLPNGWKAEYDNNQQAWYFYNGTTTTWTDPRSLPQFSQTEPAAMRAYAEWYANAYALSYANLQYQQGGEGPVEKELKRERRRAREYKNTKSLIDEASRRIQEATDQEEKRQAEIDLARAQGMLDRLRADDEAKSYPTAFYNVRSPSAPIHGTTMMMKGSSVPTPYGMPEQLFAWDMHMRSTMPTEALATVFPPPPQQKR
jgi:hypothetical protein